MEKNKDAVLFIDLIQKFNPHHDSRGRFSTSDSSAFMTTRTKDSSKQHLADKAIARAKKKTADESAAKKKADTAAKRKAAREAKKEADKKAKEDTPETLKKLNDHIKRHYKQTECIQDMSSADKKTVETALSKMVEKGDLAMRVREDSLKKILVSKFKTQIELKDGSTGGTYSPMMRKEASAQLFGHSGKNVKDNQYEKYGYLSDRKQSEVDFFNDNASDYGEIKVVFKKDRVKDKVTMTAGDSLTPALYNEMVGSKITKPSVCSIIDEEEGVKKTIKAAKNYNQGSTKSISEFTKEIGQEYIELQFHGDLTADDIQHVEYRKSISVETLKMLNAAGIKQVKVV